MRPVPTAHGAFECTPASPVGQNGEKPPVRLSIRPVTWAKSDFVSNTTGEMALAAGIVRIQSFDEGSRKITLNEGSFVVTGTAEEFIGLGAFCAGVCVGPGWKPMVYVTVVWAATSAGPRVVFFETAPAESFLNAPMVALTP